MIAWLVYWLFLPVNTPVHVKVVPSDTLAGVRYRMGLNVNPLLNQAELFKVLVTNNSGGPLPVAVWPDFPDSGCIDFLYKLHYEVHNEQGEFISLTSPALNCSLKRIGPVDGMPPPSTKFILEWAKDKTYTYDIALRHGSFVHNSRWELGPMPGRYQIHAELAYSSGLNRGDYVKVRSNSVWVTVTAEHIAEWRSLQTK